MKRSSGVLMHVSSLPSKFGIGTFGKEAFQFVDFLKNAGFKYWQVLPLGYTGYGDSPYQCFSAFAGNPYFIDFDDLVKEGLLTEEDYKNEFYGQSLESVDYGAIYNSKHKILREAYSNFKSTPNQKLREEFKPFYEANDWWLEDFSTFMALKVDNDFKPWFDWSRTCEDGDSRACRRFLADCDYYQFVQFLFFRQWKKLKAYANESGIQIIGDLPFYVSSDSADVWSNPENFSIDLESLQPTAVAGCPPDAFSKTGQLWGNVTYNWDYLKDNGYDWWIKRFKFSLEMFDVVRVDHFRGFESYWEVPFGEETAVNGEWKRGPANDLFDAIKRELGDINVIVEDLGTLSPEANEFIESTGFPRMKVLQYAFSGSLSNKHLPHNYTSNCVAYTGTHDNDTIMGWLNDSSKQSEVANAKKYLGLNDEEGSLAGILRGLWSSKAGIAIVPMQDILGISSSGRMNIPGSPSGNWTWRMKPDAITGGLVSNLLKMNERYGRKND